MLKRFFLFGYDNYYPGGGVDDLIGTYDTIEEAKAAYKDGFSVGEILDTHTAEFYRRFREGWYAKAEIIDWKLEGVLKL